MQKNIVIGINWEQNSSACLMINGEIIGACSEERFSRIKNDERYPKKSIDWLLKKFSVKKLSFFKIYGLILKLIKTLLNI